MLAPGLLQVGRTIMFMTLDAVWWERRDSGEHVILDCSLHTIAFILGRSVIHRADRSVIQCTWVLVACSLLTTIVWPCACAVLSAHAAYRKLAFLSMTDTHTYIQTQNEMQSRISCLALRHSAIILFFLWAIWAIHYNSGDTHSIILSRFEKRAHPLRALSKKMFLIAHNLWTVIAMSFRLGVYILKH